MSGYAPSVYRLVEALQASGWSAGMSGYPGWVHIPGRRTTQRRRSDLAMYLNAMLAAEASSSERF